jgi:hypothetical protein
MLSAVDLTITRDGVAGGDGHHKLAIELPDDATLLDAFQKIHRGYLVPIHGGKATWVAKIRPSGRPTSEQETPVAVFAQQWSKPMYLVDVGMTAAAGKHIHFSYLAQQSPVDVFAQLTNKRPKILISLRSLVYRARARLLSFISKA